MLLVGKNFVLHGQVDAGGIDQIQNGYAVLHGYFLGAKVLFARHREPRTSLYRGVVGHHQTGAASNSTQHDDHSGGGASALLGIHSVGGEGTDFNLGCTRIQEAFYPLSSAEFALFGEFLQALFASA